MFNGAYLDSVFGKYGSSLGPGYVFSNGIAACPHYINNAATSG